MNIDHEKLMTDILSDRLLHSAKTRRAKSRLVYTAPILLFLIFSSIYFFTSTDNNTQTINNQNLISSSKNQHSVTPTDIDDKLLIAINDKNLLLTFEPIKKPKYSDTKILEILSK